VSSRYKELLWENRESALGLLNQSRNADSCPFAKNDLSDFGREIPQMDARNLRSSFSRRNVVEEQAVYFSAEWQN
jgi:hypothetical protein